MLLLPWAFWNVKVDRRPDGKLRGDTYLVDSEGNTFTDVVPGRKISRSRRAQQQKDDIETIISLAALLEQRISGDSSNTT